MTCKWFEVCPMRTFEREGKINNKWKKEYCLSKDNWRNCKRFQMEEKGIPHDDNMLPNGNIDKNLKIPFYALATDLIKGEKVILSSGKLIDAVEASSRIPLFYSPKKIGRKIFVDGAITCPVPTGVLRGKCDFIISVPLPVYNKKIHPRHYLKIMNILDRSIDILVDKLMKTELNCEQPDLIINLDSLEKFSTFDFDHAEEIIEIGRKSTEKVIKELLKKLSEKMSEI